MFFESGAHKSSEVDMWRYSRIGFTKRYEWHLCRDCTKALRKDFIRGYKSRCESGIPKPNLTPPMPEVKDPLIERIKAGRGLPPIESDGSVGTGFRTYP